VLPLNKEHTAMLILHSLMLNNTDLSSNLEELRMNCQESYNTVGVGPACVSVQSELSETYLFQRLGENP